MALQRGADDRSAPARSRMSAATHEQPPLSRPPPRASTSSRRPAITTDAPQRASSAAAALPRFVPPPVTTATRPPSAPAAKTREGSSAYSPSTLITSRLRPPAVELAVEDLLPGPEVEPALGHRDDHLVVDEQVLEVRVAVVLAAAVVAIVARVGQQLARDLVRRLGQLGGASLSSHSSASAWRPGSSSLIHTPAVMCIAHTSAIPSAIPASRTASATSSVIRTNSRRRSVLNVR